jgi:hypothetical protein
LIFLVKVNLKELGTVVAPWLAQFLLGVLPPVIWTLECAVVEDPPSRERRAPVTARVRRDLDLVVVVAPHDVVATRESHLAWLFAERRRARQRDPPLHTLDAWDIFIKRIE